jgi:hypothetical protein
MCCGPRVGVSQGWISRLVARYRLEGEAAFEPRSRRPLTHPTRLPQPTIDLIIELREKLAGKGLDNGPRTIAWHLHHHPGLIVSPASVHRHLHPAGLIIPTPQKRPRSSYIRFAADRPNQRWQADFAHWWLADTTHVEIVNWLDDRARYALSVTAHRRVTGGRQDAVGGGDREHVLRVGALPRPDVYETNRDQLVGTHLGEAETLHPPVA